MFKIIGVDEKFPDSEVIIATRWDKESAELLFNTLVEAPSKPEGVRYLIKKIKKDKK